MPLAAGFEVFAAFAAYLIQSQQQSSTKPITGTKLKISENLLSFR
jgi:hypothetical protein